MPQVLAPARPMGIDHAKLLRRLEQLHTAMGESVAPAASQAPAAASGTHAWPMHTKVAARHLAQIGSTLLIAGALWWTLGAGTRPAEAPQAAMAAPAAALAPSVAALAAAQPMPTVALAPPVAAAAASPTTLNEQAIRDALESWRLDWSRRDVEAYLRHYAPSFTPASGQARSDWEATRRKNILSRPAIRVEVNDLRIDPQGGQQVRVTFLQNYMSGTYQETAQPKTMRLQQVGQDWLIVGEWQGPEPQSLPKTP